MAKRKSIAKSAKAEVAPAISETSVEPETPVDRAAPQPAPPPELPPELPSEQPPEHPQNSSGTPGFKWFLAGLALLLVGCAFWLAYNTRMSSARDIDQLTAAVAKLAVLPSNEKPTITTVVDKNKINQPFLADAREGDKVLLYFQAGKAVVYRPSSGQIVNMGPLTQPPVRVFLRNGTAAAAIPGSIRAKLNQPSAYTIVSQDSAPKRDYRRTVVIDVNGNRPDVAARIARTLDAKTAAMPDTESRPDADVLVIVGSDAK